MSQRYVFKFFGSVGPGGAFSSLTEQICTSIFPMAYKVGDEESVETEIDKQLKTVRGEFINEIFQMKNKFERGVASNNEE